MTHEQTPLEKLDDAIHEFFAATQTVEGKVITGWTLGCSTSRLNPDAADDEDTRATGATYALGPQTSVTDAAGIVRFLDVVIERATWSMLNDGD